jgi:diaminopimelate decarboxylase
MIFQSTELPPFLAYRKGRLYLEELALEELGAQFGTPVYIYSAGALRAAYQRYLQAFTSVGLNLSLCYAIKANSNLSIIRLFGELGAGADVVSGGELYRALQAGIAPEQIVFAGVGKTAAEMDYALEQKIGTFNIESASELALLERRAVAVGQEARVSIRVNPNVDAQTHPYIATGRNHNKFGLNPTQSLELARYAAGSASLFLVGLQMHIGSQVLQVGPLVEAFKCLLSLASQLEVEEIYLEQLDLGGGLGVTYQDEQPEQPDKLAAAIADLLKEHQSKQPYRLISEPGRYLTANAGVLATSVLYIKQGELVDPCFAIVDAGMNDLIRPALYNAKHRIMPLHERPGALSQVYEVVGPVCESGDFLGHEVTLTELKEGDMLGLLGAGAYGFSMASNYNSRLRPPEILVDEYTARLIRHRETYEDLVFLED